MAECALVRRAHEISTAPVDRCCEGRGALTRSRLAARYAAMGCHIEVVCRVAFGCDPGSILRSRVF
jgi:hypothetical protein